MSALQQEQVTATRLHVQRRAAGLPPTDEANCSHVASLSPSTEGGKGRAMLPHSGSPTLLTACAALVPSCPESCTPGECAPQSPPGLPADGRGHAGEVGRQATPPSRLDPRPRPQPPALLPPGSPAGWSLDSWRSSSADAPGVRVEHTGFAMLLLRLWLSEVACPYSGMARQG